MAIAPNSASRASRRTLHANRSPIAPSVAPPAVSPAPSSRGCSACCCWSRCSGASGSSTASTRSPQQDQAQPADAIAVFGAAEYSGRPSPVYHARLDHAVALYNRQIAPLVITLGGGSDRDSGKTEGGVGRDYLLAKACPSQRIIAETNSFATASRRAASPRSPANTTSTTSSSSRTRTHLFRIQQLCAAGRSRRLHLAPRPRSATSTTTTSRMRYFHEILSYTALRLHLERHAASTAGWTAKATTEIRAIVP